MRILAALLVLLLQTTSPVAAASELEIIDLHNRPAEDIIPLIKPLLDSGESVSGRGFQLVLKANSARQAQIRELVGKLDRAAAQLMISVFQGSERDLAVLGLSAGARYRDNHTSIQLGDNAVTSTGAGIRAQANGAQASVNRIGTRARLEDRPVYRLRVTEGESGYIETGKSIPYFSGQVYEDNGRQIVEPGIDYKDVTSGFYVRPRLNGERVILDISPQRESLDAAGNGAINVRRAATTVSGRLGEWIPLGGTTGQAGYRASQPGAHYSTSDRHSESIWIRADKIQ